MALFQRVAPAAAHALWYKDGQAEHGHPRPACTPQDLTLFVLFAQRYSTAQTGR
jgi:hypothetical protein